MSDYYDRWSALTKEQKHEVLEIENDNRFDDAEEVACPYCDQTQNFEGEDMPYDNGNSIEYECGHCGKRFDIVAHVSMDWSTCVPVEEAMKIFLERQKSSGDSK